MLRKLNDDSIPAGFVSYTDSEGRKVILTEDAFARLRKVFDTAEMHAWEKKMQAFKIGVMVLFFVLCVAVLGWIAANGGVPVKCV